MFFIKHLSRIAESVACIGERYHAGSSPKQNRHCASTKILVVVLMGTAASAHAHAANAAVSLSAIGSLSQLAMGACESIGTGSVTISQATFDGGDNKLLVRGTYAGAASNPTVRVIDDLTDVQLAQQGGGGGNGEFEFEITNIGDIPCRVRVEVGLLCSTRTVVGAPAFCDDMTGGGNMPPTCAILSPMMDVSIETGDTVVFAGEAADPEGGALTYEWDFGGGADARPTVVNPGPIVFDWNRGSFLVTLIVTDDAGARCESYIVVNVGLPPEGLPPMVAEQPAPGAAGSGGSDYVVLPFNDLGMHCADLASDPLSILPPFNTLNAHLILRGSTGGNRPTIVDDAANRLRYSAASNPNVPVGPGSINSTSQNFPLGAKLRDAQIRKTDFWDAYSDQGPCSPGDLDGNNVIDEIDVGLFVDVLLTGAGDETALCAADLNGDQLQDGIDIQRFVDCVVAGACPGGTSTGTIASLLFPGLDPLPDEGLQTIDNPDHGRYMPGIADPYVANDPQAFGAFIGSKKWFTAQGIPMTGVDDRGRPNSYPLMRVQAVDSSSGTILATSDAVVPVSSEVDCRDCHAFGTVGADPTARPAGPAFVSAASPDRIDVETSAKLNALILHDHKHGTTLTTDGRPVLCAECHRSNALAEVGGPGGDPALANMSRVMHGFHGQLQTDPAGELVRDATGEPVLIDPMNPQPSAIPLIPTDLDAPMETNCFKCHPGKITQCFRGVMFTAGQTCISCHGDMLAVGGAYPLQSGHTREPWFDEPRCGSCHSGIGSDRVQSVSYDLQDPAATPSPPLTPRFAENPDTLYRNSLDGHAAVACEACHGSPHAIWPHRDPDANDNLLSIQRQGYVGPIRECTVCHVAGSFPNGTLDGPHGMHPVNDPNWIKGEGTWHKHYAQDNGNGDQCADCHGADHRGTRLARVPVNRVLRDAEGVVRATLAAGEIVSCDLCHSLADSFED